jgi:hypothetical protein
VGILLGFRPRGSGFDSQRCQILWVAVGLERGPLSLVRINDEILERKSSGSGQKTEINDRVGSPVLTMPKSGGRSVGIVRLRTKCHGVWFLCLTFKNNFGWMTWISRVNLQILQFETVCLCSQHYCWHVSPVFWTQTNCPLLTSIINCVVHSRPWNPSSRGL